MSQYDQEERIRTDVNAIAIAPVKHVYVTPQSDDKSWVGVIFVAKGPYADAILRFRIEFPVSYPGRPPIVTFQNDIFHPLVTPLTTYTHASRERRGAASSHGDERVLIPGGFNLGHGFPEWSTHEDVLENRSIRPHFAAILQYMRIVFDSEEALDSIPLDCAVNEGAWHAWNSFRHKTPTDKRNSKLEQGYLPEQQPGGARRPSEWNWQGVWADRVGKSIRATLADSSLYGWDSSDIIHFKRMEKNDVDLLLHGAQS